MFFVIPLEYRTSRTNRGAPVANLLLIAANVVLFGLGWCWAVGPGSGVLSVVMYGFCHAGFWHLVFNMWFLWVFGNPVNRRIGNGYYLLAYLGTTVALGILVRLFLHVNLVGSSGAIFAVVIVALILIPSGLLQVAYLLLFPLSVIPGLLRPPKYWLHWFIRWGVVSVPAVWCLVLVPLLELWSLFWNGWGWGTVAHLLGMVCGVAVVLMLPTRITMPGRAAAGVLR
jgi:membrane associated rhomboid family serine protease